jgi:uncharacterized protein
METLIIIAGVVLLLVGLIGCIAPVLPGPVIAYMGLVVLQFLPEPVFSVNFLITWGVVVVLITLLDYVVPVWGTKKFGGSKSGVNGSIAGAVIGFLFFPPLGLIIGPFAGAYLGELVAGKNSRIALRSAFGSFIGFLAGTFIKIIAVLIMIYHFINGLV